MPYDPSKSIRDQVIASIESSLEHFRIDDSESVYLDVLLLHSLLPTGQQTLEVWRTLEEYVPHKIRQLGICNINFEQLEVLYQMVKIKPSIVQNRFYSINAYDKVVRNFCLCRNIGYQAYWVLKKNDRLVNSKPVSQIAMSAGVSKQAALFYLLQSLGVDILDGTTDVEHMQMNIHGVAKLGDWANQLQNNEEWLSLQHIFSMLLSSMEHEIS
jgi:diketogulonate reductase-like aldo/keto reductase